MIKLLGWKSPVTQMYNASDMQLSNLFLLPRFEKVGAILDLPYPSGLSDETLNQGPVSMT